MPYIQCPELTIPITTAGADGTITVTNPVSVENFFPGAQCSIINSLNTISETVQIVELVSPTSLRVKRVTPSPTDGYFHGHNYGYSDMASPTNYSGGRLTQHQGVVPVEFDYTSWFRVH